MSLSTAVRRSYRYFIPSALLNPRILVRQFYTPAFIYILGMLSGMYFYAQPSQCEKITIMGTVAMLSLAGIRWWAMRNSGESSTTVTGLSE